MRLTGVFGTGTVNPQVTGSNPVRGAKFSKEKALRFHDLGAFSFVCAKRYVTLSHIQ